MRELQLARQQLEEAQLGLEQARAESAAHQEAASAAVCAHPTLPDCNVAGGWLWLWAGPWECLTHWLVCACLCCWAAGSLGGGGGGGVRGVAAAAEGVAGRAAACRRQQVRVAQPASLHHITPGPSSGGNSRPTRLTSTHYLHMWQQHTVRSCQAIHTALHRTRPRCRHIHPHTMRRKEGERGSRVGCAPEEGGSLTILLCLTLAGIPLPPAQLCRASSPYTPYSTYSTTSSAPGTPASERRPTAEREAGEDDATYELRCALQAREVRGRAAVCMCPLL